MTPKDVMFDILIWLYLSLLFVYPRLLFSGFLSLFFPVKLKIYKKKYITIEIHVNIVNFLWLQYFLGHNSVESTDHPPSVKKNYWLFVPKIIKNREKLLFVFARHTVRFALRSVFLAIILLQIRRHGFYTWRIRLSENIWF